MAQVEGVVPFFMAVVLRVLAGEGSRTAWMGTTVPVRRGPGMVRVAGIRVTDCGVGHLMGTIAPIAELDPEKLRHSQRHNGDGNQQIFPRQFHADNRCRCTGDCN